MYPPPPADTNNAGCSSHTYWTPNGTKRWKPSISVIICFHSPLLPKSSTDQMVWKNPLWPMLKITILCDVYLSDVLQICHTVQMTALLPDDRRLSGSAIKPSPDRHKLMQKVCREIPQTHINRQIHFGKKAKLARMISNWQSKRCRLEIWLEWLILAFYLHFLDCKKVIIYLWNVFECSLCQSWISTFKGFENFYKGMCFASWYYYDNNTLLYWDAWRTYIEMEE